MADGFKVMLLTERYSMRFIHFYRLDDIPIAVINVEGDPFLTDVNVHPSKQQIRMSKEGELLTLIKESIRTGDSEKCRLCQA